MSQLVGMQTCAATLEISMAVSQKIGNQSTSRPRDITPGHIPKGYSIIPQGHLLNNIHSSIIGNNLETTRCPSTEEWMKKVYIYIMMYYSTVKNDMKFAGKWMELEKSHPE